MKTSAAMGAYVLGRIDALGVAPKVITQKSGVHPSTFSRCVNGIKPFTDRQILEIGIAIGEAQASAKK